MADTTSFTRAADQLHVSEPALSQQICKLETELGFPLFARRARGNDLTPQGRELLEPAREVVTSAETFTRHAQSLAGGPRRLVIGFRAQAANELTRELITAFRVRRPDVEVILHQYPLEATTAGPDTGEVDLALLRLPLAPRSATRFYNRPGICYRDVVDAVPSVVALAWDPHRLAANPSAQAFVDATRDLVASPPPDMPHRLHREPDRVTDAEDDTSRVHRAPR